MILTSPRVTVGALEARTGWELNERGACRGEVCIPLSDATIEDGIVDVDLLAEQMSMPIVRDRRHGLLALGPASGGQALSSAVSPPLSLPDLNGDLFDLASLRGQKILLVAWASW